MRIIKAAVAALALVAFGAHAQLTQSDSRFGAGSLVTDANTGLSWLQLTYTQGLSAFDVWSQLATTYSGFRLADRSEVITLLDAVSSTDCVNGALPCWQRSDFSTSDPVEVANMQSFVTVFGGYSNSTGGVLATGFTGGCLDPNTSISQGCTLTVESGSAYATLASRADGFVSSFTATPHTGTWLVADGAVAPVPEASTYALMLAGLGAVVLARRRRA